MESPKSYFVLIGGESCDTQGANVHTREYLHTSLSFVAQAYDQLRSAGVPRSQIITIVQLKDYLESPHLHECPHARTTMLQSCQRLLAEGGADYDFHMVNSGTVFAVLLGLRDRQFPKVVPNDCSTKSLFFAIYSHGNCHPVLSTPDANQPTRHQTSNPVSPITTRRPAASDIIPTHENEWYAHLPYPCQPEAYRELMYSFVSTEGGHANGHKAPECQLYATHIAMIVSRLCHQQECTRPVVGLLNFCLSGGGLDFMRREGFRTFYRPEHWPVYLMSSAQSNKDALVGGLWETYFPCLIQQLLAKTDTTISHSTFHELYLNAKTMYRQRNVYELYGHITHLAYPSSGTSFRSHLQPLLTSGEHGAPDFVKISQLQIDYRKGGIYYRRKTYIYDTYNWEVEVDLVEVVARCLCHIALPDAVFGELSGIDKLQACDVFYFDFDSK